MDTTNRHTRKSKAPNPLWAKMANGARHHADPHSLLSDGERKVLREQRQRRDAIATAREERHAQRRRTRQ